MSKQTVLSIAEEFLTKQPFDAGHDLEHHQIVLQIALDIATHIQEPVDVEALKIASMWHEPGFDPNASDRNVIKLKTCDYLKKLLLNKGYQTDFIEKVILAVQFHSYEDEPRNIEGRVLYDADKLSAVDLARMKKIVMAHSAG